jgi:DNA excision repair protein ERCC-4
MTSSLRSSILIKEFLSSIDPTAPSGIKGRKMMENRLHRYVSRKANFSEKGNIYNALLNNPDTVKNAHNVDRTQKEIEGLSEALKRKDQEQANRAAGRRRVRGRTPSAVSSTGGRLALRSAHESFITEGGGEEPGTVSVGDL